MLCGFIVDRSSLVTLMRGALLLVLIGAGLVCASMMP
jgi:hypothetical protein